MKNRVIDKWLSQSKVGSYKVDLNIPTGCFNHLKRVTDVIFDAHQKNIVPESARGLILCDNSSALAFYEFCGPEVTVGRDASCSVRIDDKFMSKVHLQISLQNDFYIVTDAHSKNGIKVNGKNVDSRVLVNGDFIEAGMTTLIYSA